MPLRTYREVRWPYNGLHVGRSFHGQAHDTTVSCQNVRNYDPNNGRSRGAQRAGCTRYLDAQAAGSGSNQIQDLACVVTSQTSNATATDLNTRQVKAVSVCAGNVQTFTTSAFTTCTNGTGALASAAPVIFSAGMYGKLYFADGINNKLLDIATTTVSAWTPTAGSFPANGAHYPRLIELWRGRMVLAGIKGDAHNWFMSAVDDPLDFDYGATESHTMAVAGNGGVGPGLIGDIVNSLIPYDDDTMIVGCDHTIYQFTGDPASGGSIDLISDITGMAFGRPWAKSYDGSVYFMGSRGGIYRMEKGQKPLRISSDRIENSLSSIDLNLTIVRCVYDDVTQGIHFFVTPLDASASTHYFYDIRKDAFFADVFEDANYNPVAVLLLDGDDVDDRVVLFGGFDRRIRKIDYTNPADDAEPIKSFVWLGPLRADQGRKIHLNELIATLDDSCDGAYYEVYAAQGAQVAYERGQRFHSGTWKPGRNPPDGRRASGTSIYIKIGNDEMDRYFACETIMASIEQAGLISSRMNE